MNFAQDLTNAVATGGRKAANATAPKGRKAATKPAATPVQATPAATPATGKPAKGQAPKAAPVYKLGKAFVPKSSGKYSQAENWAVVVAALPATRSELVAAIKAAAEAGGYADRCNATGFVQGRLRDGHLIAG